MTSIGLLTAFDRHFDEMFRSANTAMKYPPYNLIKSDEESYKFEFAVAGFTKEELEIVVEGNTLRIKGKQNTEEKVYLHRGIAKRTFQQTFTLAPEMIVTGSELEDGILTVYMRKEIPEHMKPRKIEIGGAPVQASLLLE